MEFPGTWHLAPGTSSRGFTLIELVVVTAIIVVVTSVVLVNNNRFGGVVQLENLAYDVALSVRQAQVFGVSVQRYGSGASADFTSGYGMHFNIKDPVHYEFFADVDKDGFFDSDENVAPSPYTIRSGFRIAGLCSPQGQDAATCMNATSVTQVDIAFKRPEADAWISAGGVGCEYGEGTCAASARIVLLSPRGDVMSVLVGANGQISVQREAAQ
ncbi:MAG: prepilin-type N-terminal cleavage/methylation domain-containing protein [bacterium]|nr:prepilin-type N-terminal cleavage/methylation domain-containing protein [bacterium]